MKLFIAVLMCVSFLSACAPPATPSPPPTATPPPATIEPIFAETPLPPPYSGKFELKPVPEDRRLGKCEQKLLAEPKAHGLTLLSTVETLGCQYGEIGLLEIGGRLYATQGGLNKTSFNMIDVTVPTSPKPVGVWFDTGFSYAADLKPFRQNGRSFLGVSYEREQATALCGIAVFEVTDPRNPVVIGRYDGGDVGAETPWCNVHTIEIDHDEAGNANYLLASDTDTHSLRVLDIRDLNQVRQVNTYHLHEHPHVNPVRGADVINFVHDSTISADRVYVAYWHAGAVILDKAKLYAGIPQSGYIVKPTENVAPGGFLTHHMVPSPDGNYLFVEDEINVQHGVRLFDIRDPSQPREIAAIHLQDQIFTPHNLLFHDGLLYVGWYHDGVRVFRMDTQDPAKPVIEEVGSYPVRDFKTYSSFGPFTGIWGVRVHECTLQGKPRTCVYASDIEGGLVILALDEGITAR